jgi:hypothetical protein
MTRAAIVAAVIVAWTSRVEATTDPPTKKHASLDVEVGMIALAWHPPPQIMPLSGKAASLTGIDERTAVSMASRITSGMHKGIWEVAVDFDYNPMSMVGWRAGYYVEPPRLGAFQARAGIVGALGMWFDSAGTSKLEVSPMAYVSMLAGVRWRLGNYLFFAFEGERTLVSTRDFWGGAIMFGADGPL